MIKAVLFDLDGILFDSEAHDQALNKEYFEKINCPIPPERCYNMICVDEKTDWWGKIVEGYEDQIDTVKLKKDLFTYTRARWKELDFSTIMFEEIPEVLQGLKDRGMRLAVASSSPLDYVQRALNDACLMDYYDVVISGKDFERGKPNPDVYLYCAAQFNLTPEECVVIEDSTNGIAAGKNAGMKVIARRDTRFNMNQSRADYFVDNEREIFAIIDELNKN